MKPFVSIIYKFITVISFNLANFHTCGAFCGSNFTFDKVISLIQKFCKICIDIIRFYLIEERYRKDNQG